MGLRVKALIDACDAKSEMCEAQAKGFRLGMENAKALFVQFLAQEEQPNQPQQESGAASSPSAAQARSKPK